MSGPVIVLDGKISKFPYPLFPKNKIPYSMSFRIQVPPLVGDYVYELGLPEIDLELYNIVVSCSGYKDTDNWSLITNGTYVAMSIYTKEYMQTKPLPVIKKIVPNVGNNKFIFRNSTGTHKNVYLDMDFVIKEPIPLDERLEISPKTMKLDINTGSAFYAYYTRDGKTSDVTHKCEWSITDFYVSYGTVSGTNHTGTAIVTAKYKNFSATADVIVSYSLPSRVIIRMWDNGGEDNDTVNLVLDGDRVAETVVLRNAPNYFDIQLDLFPGTHVLKIEAVRSDGGPCTAGVRIFDINWNQVYESGFSINVPIYGEMLEEPFPFVEWTLEVT